MIERSWANDHASLSQTQAQIPHSGGNVFRLLARREIHPRTKFLPKKQWGEAPKQNYKYSPFWLKNEAKIDARRGLLSWVEAESLGYLSAKYCPLEPPPRSTIAVAFSTDWKQLASTHGDHTVKIIDSMSGHCLKVLSAHRRTPWVVRFHPEHPEILASGSLDHEVRVWNANTSECIGSHDFYHPIASIAFHAEGELLAVASGHKLYLWHYSGSGEISSPVIVLKTRRSLRAVHFHPHAAPFLLTAEVNDLDCSDSSISQATSLGCLHYPPTSVHISNLHSVDNLSMATELPLMSLPIPCPSSFVRDDISPDLHAHNGQSSSTHSLAESSASLHIRVNANSVEHDNCRVAPLVIPPIISSTDAGMHDRLANDFAAEAQSSICGTTIDGMDTPEMLRIEEYHPDSASNQDTLGPSIRPLPLNSHTLELPDPVTSQLESSGFSQHHSLPSRYSTSSGLPFLQGCLPGQSQARRHPILSMSNHMQDFPQGSPGVYYAPFASNSFTCNNEIPVTSLSVPPIINRSLVPESSGLQQQQQQPQLGNLVFSPEIGIPNSIQRVASPVFGVIPSESSAALPTTASSELPCTVKLRLWSHDVENSCAPLDTDKCRLTIPHVVLCSEMGAHFSPCGRYLAACVACVLPRVEAEPGLVSLLNQDVGSTGFSPTRHPTLAHKVIYELRIYSLEKSTFGSILVSRVVRAAHCLTSVQFSPTSEHILLAYGRRHSSLLKGIVIDGEVSLPVYTVLEVYRVSDLELVSVLPSAEDEVNVASFHPLVGGGLVYGTREGKLRVLQYDRTYRVNGSRSILFPASNIVEVQTRALEG
ncbi:hypothetical protein ACH5RR_010494 [Cinchona calisaya]|uniref:Activating molecule in BECN1-regulated autophagy protein 1 n=1 Tax=Cinchona calisaya TaxID=153742 RepID=A0ABD3AJ31_9GENT